MKRVFATLMCIALASAVWAAPPSVVLDDGGIQFPDGTLLESAAAVDPPATLTVAVNCPGESINDALATPARELNIQISGVCTENVVIERSRVKLTGTDAASDKIIGVITGAQFEPPVVSIEDSADVVLENLTIGPGGRNGVIINRSEVEVYNCVVDDNPRWGLVAAMASDVRGNNLTISDNVRGGLMANDGTVMRLSDTTMTGNGAGRFSVVSIGASYIYLTDSSISGDNGVQVFMSGFVYGDDTPITAVNVALESSEQGDINWFGIDLVPDISGGVQANWKSFIWMANVNQTGAGAGDGNTLNRDSTIQLENVTLQGLEVNLFSNGVVEGASDLGAVNCNDASSDLYCNGTTVTSSTCSLCPGP